MKIEMRKHVVGDLQDAEFGCGCRYGKVTEPVVVYECKEAALKR